MVYGYFGGAAGLHAARLKLISKGIHATEKSTVVNGVSFKVAPDGNNVQVVLTNYAQILASAAKTFQTTSVSKQQIIGLGEQIATLRQATVQAFTRLKAEKSDPARQRQLNKLQQLGQELDQNINAMKREISQQNYNQTQQTLLYMLDNYREYLRLLQKSPNN